MCLEAGRTETRGETTCGVDDVTSSVLDGLNDRVDKTSDTVKSRNGSAGGSVLDGVDKGSDGTGDTANDVVLDVVDKRSSSILDGLDTRNGLLDTTNEVVDVVGLAAVDNVVDRLVQRVNAVVNVVDLVESRGNTIGSTLHAALDAIDNTVDTWKVGELAALEVGIDGSLNVGDILRVVRSID
jgi:phage-related protein